MSGSNGVGSGTPGGRCGDRCVAGPFPPGSTGVGDGSTTDCGALGVSGPTDIGVEDGAPAGSGIPGDNFVGGTGSGVGPNAGSSWLIGFGAEPGGGVSTATGASGTPTPGDDGVDDGPDDGPDGTGSISPKPGNESGGIDVGVSGKVGSSNGAGSTPGLGLVKGLGRSGTTLDGGTDGAPDGTGRSPGPTMGILGSNGAGVGTPLGA